MQEKVLLAESRKETGKNANRRLRDKGFIPAVIYSHGKAENIQIQAKDFSKLFQGKISESVLFDLKINDKDPQTAFVKDVQFNAVTDAIIHLDLYKITKGEKIQTHLPLEIIGTPKGIKLGGQLEIHDRVIDVECLPLDLPEKFIVDVSELMIDESIHAGDLKLGDSIKLISNRDAVIAIVHPKRKEEAAASGADE
jgi:large subunit ribosomal protein L25